MSSFAVNEVTNNGILTNMNKKVLSQTNPYLKNAKKKAEMVRISMATSTAIEGVHIKRLAKTHHNRKSK